MCEAFLLGQGVGLGQLIGETVGDADVAGLAGLYNSVQPVQNVVQGRLVVPHVVDVEVHIVHPQIFQAGVNHLLNVALARDAVLDFFRGAGQEFGGYHHLVPAGKVSQGPAQILLAGAALVGDGGVEKVDSQFQAAADDLPGVFLVQGPAVLAVFGVAEPHASHADAGDVQV